MSHEHRRDHEPEHKEHTRIEDTFVGRAMYFFPIVAGTATLLISIGCYVTVIQSLKENMHAVEGRMMVAESSGKLQAELMVRQQTLMESMDARVKSLESWRDLIYGRKTSTSKYMYPMLPMGPEDKG